MGTSFVAAEREGRRLIVPAARIGRIVVDTGRDRGRAEVIMDADGERLGWMDEADANRLAQEPATVVPAAPGWWVLMPLDGPEGLWREPVIAWRIDADPTLGGALPVTPSWETNQELAGDRCAYVVLPPEGNAMSSDGGWLEGRGDDTIRDHFRQSQAAGA